MISIRATASPPEKLLLCIGGPLDGEQHRYNGDAWDELPGGIYAIMGDLCDRSAWYQWYPEA